MDAYEACKITESHSERERLRKQEAIDINFRNRGSESREFFIKEFNSREPKGDDNDDAAALPKQDNVLAKPRKTRPTRLNRAAGPRRHGSGPTGNGSGPTGTRMRDPQSSSVLDRLGGKGNPPSVKKRLGSRIEDKERLGVQVDPKLMKKSAKTPPPKVKSMVVCEPNV